MLLQRGDEHLYGGVFNWFAYKPDTLEPRCWGGTWRTSLFTAQDAQNNCSPSGAGWRWDGIAMREIRPARGGGAGDSAAGPRCFGPYPFAKGPLYFLSRAALRWLVASPAFREDVRSVEAAMGQSATSASASATGEAVGRLSGRGAGGHGRGGARGQAPIGTRLQEWEDVTLLEDAHVGFWLSFHPSLQLVTLAQYHAWCDQWEHAGDLSLLLMAHRVPWEHYGWLSTMRKSSAAERVRYRWECEHANASSFVAGHSSFQHRQACALQVHLLPRLYSRCSKCVCSANPPRAAAHGQPRAIDRTAGKLPDRCTMSREEKPRVPEQCAPPSG